MRLLVCLRPSAPWKAKRACGFAIKSAKAQNTSCSSGFRIISNSLTKWRSC